MYIYNEIDRLRLLVFISKPLVYILYKSGYYTNISDRIYYTNTVKYIYSVTKITMEEDSNKYLMVYFVFLVLTKKNN